ncbi:autotransporter domain-containing protein [Herbaspirillum sp. 3C11]|uniref:autotransporter outer membrane beta-barrel domain-containing protein n=2 Tax=Herbaspirillum TaxID=963 RepID=UPI001ADB1D42|nr:autotransporter outer membrane beta-barrel domain-containing protein [Herbaspirillum sp. 3C11]
MATNYTVTSNTDNGTISTPGTLSWAIDQANTGSGNTITIVTNVEVISTLPTITQPITITANSAVQIYGGTLVLGNGTAGSVSLGNNVRVIGADGNNRGSTNYNGGNAVSGSGFALANSGTIIAGNGDIDSGGVGVGIGGSGGNGVSGSGFTLTNFGTITAGNGASGGSGGSSDNGGDSGNGGNGVSGSGFTLVNSGNINGGRGAKGGDGGSSGRPGSAGNGGNGVSGSGFTLTNSGTINGGNGGSGGNVNTGIGGAGGSGGNGVSGSGFTLTNSGSINGGNGGNGGASSGAGSGGSNTVGSAAVVSTGNATIYNSGTIAGGTGRGLTANAVTLSGGGNKLVLQVGGQFTGNVVSAGGDTFALGGASGSGSFSLSDIGATAKYQGFSAFTKQDAGTWTLTGSGTSSWTAQGGTLVLADSMSLTGTLAVQSGGTVTANNATVSGAVNNAGTFGVSAGKTVHTGAYTNASGGTLRIGVSGMSSYGKLVVNGTATLGGTLFVDAASASGISAGSLSQVISATTISGTFATTSTNSLLFTYTPSYVGNQVNLLVAAAPSSGGSGGTTIFKTTMEQGNFPGSGAAKALDQIIGANPNGAIGSLFQGFITGQQRQLSNAVSQTLPLLVGGSQVAVNSAFSGVNRVVQSRIDGNRGLSSGDEFLGDRNVWFKPFGSWANQGDRNGVSGFNASTYGVVAGVDRPFSEQARAGVALAYARSTVDGNSSVAPQSSKVDVYQLIGYGSYSLDQDTELNLQGDIARNSNRGKRSIAFASSVAEGAYDSTGVHAGVGLARSFALSPATTFTPSIRADYTWIRDAGYTESGAGALNLNVDSRSASQFVLSTDGKLNLQLNPDTNLAFNAGVGYDTINKQASITSAYAGAPGVSFATYGLEQSPWIGRVGAALSTTTTGGVSLSLRYDLEARSSFTNQTASAKARWRF